VCSWIALAWFDVCQNGKFCEKKKHFQNIYYFLTFLVFLEQIEAINRKKFHLRHGLMKPDEICEENKDAANKLNAALSHQTEQRKVPGVVVKTSAG
jgi:hypothetical protein